ncbi:sigma factor-like helix-turn-helix DNA-binding protein [Cryptosporangium aurantiacum]|uniref:Sigma-70, region 4 n=1 Tax=Cryptosporangium aurantiacum TaxID=134849 RepID=A0A1M7TUY0_9ACTN|nr:sigma factor-like helix-turn-helix DNA-binding protein [Cryptosporangium aurantiacum]SHN74527.1 Sigma-70, region 4 [Cryptosporangium aurantiacum]
MEDIREVADAVRPALLVALEQLEPAERLAFVLHDLFAVPFDAIAPLMRRSPATVRLLAARARRQMRGTRASADPAVVDALLAAARNGDYAGLLAVLDPDVVLRADAVPRGDVGGLVRGAGDVAEVLLDRAGSAVPALVDGRPGAVSGPPREVFDITVIGRRVHAVEILADPEILDALDLEFSERERR